MGTLCATAARSWSLFGLWSYGDTWSLSMRGLH
jgi:hypothetical protein